MSKYKFLLAASLLLGTVGSFAQTGNAVYPTNTVASTMAVGTVTLNHPFSVELFLYYSLNLPPASYITQAQLTNDVASFVAAYPSLQDPPEAVLNSVANALINKYPQINAVTLDASYMGSLTGYSTIMVYASNPASGPNPYIVLPAIRRPKELK